MADNRKLSRVATRILLLLLAAVVLYALLGNYLSGDTAQLGRLLLVVTMVLIARFHIVPVLFSRSPKSSQSVPARGESCDEASHVVAVNDRKTSAKAAFITLLVVCGMWLGLGALFSVEMQNGGNPLGLLRTGVIGTGIVSAVALLLIKLDAVDASIWRVILSTAEVPLIVAVAAIGWWVAPAVVVVLCLGKFDSELYFGAIFPMIYVVLPAAAISIRIFRRDWK